MEMKMWLQCALLGGIVPSIWTPARSGGLAWLSVYLSSTALAELITLHTHFTTVRTVTSIARHRPFVGFRLEGVRVCVTLLTLVCPWLAGYTSRRCAVVGRGAAVSDGLRHGRKIRVCCVAPCLCAVSPSLARLSMRQRSGTQGLCLSFTESLSTQAGFGLLVGFGEMGSHAVGKHCILLCSRAFTGNLRSNFWLTGGC
jgi:hypothetical protein